MPALPQRAPAEVGEGANQSHIAWIRRYMQEGPGSESGSSNEVCFLYRRNMIIKKRWSKV